MISQGASERNLSFVIEEADLPRAVRLLHEAFFQLRTVLHRLTIPRSGNRVLLIGVQSGQKRKWQSGINRGFETPPARCIAYESTEAEGDDNVRAESAGERGTKRRGKKRWPVVISTHGSGFSC